MKKILITGITGFVGKNLAIYLHCSGYEIYGLGRTLPEKEDWHVQTIKEFYSYNDAIDYNQFDTIIHTAGKAHDLKNVSNEQAYFEANTELTEKIYSQFSLSNASKFIYFSSVKACADSVEGSLFENDIPAPKTAYGKSKLAAETAILKFPNTNHQKYFILRPCMIHGKGNKGNLNLLYQLVSKGIPWPLGAFNNQRSFCNIDNLSFIVQELIEKENIASGIYNIADNDSISTNEMIQLIAESKNKKAGIWHIPKNLIIALAKLGDKLKLPLNSERLQKLTESYLVDNAKINFVIEKKLPFSTKEGLLKTFQSFNQ
jgi:nucleoside-diphosphate-sugar epimerase